MSKKQNADSTPETTTESTTPATETPETKKTLFFAIDDSMATIFKVMDCPKQVRDICKILLKYGELSEKDLIQAMDDGGIKTRQNTERILAYYLKTLTHEIGVTVQSR